METYWQSDGPQPHVINIQFAKKMEIEEIEIYSNHKLDESYTPQKISIMAGPNFQELREVKTFELEEISGWISFSFKEMDENTMTQKLLCTNFVQICILQNHQNGRDTHLRQVKIYGPKKPSSSLSTSTQFNSVDYSQFDTLR